MENAKTKWQDDPDASYKDIIQANHPTVTGDHETYSDAMRLVGQRHSKYALIDLVNWLLVRLKNRDWEDKRWQLIETAPKAGIFLGIIQCSKGQFGSPFMALWNEDTGRYECEAQTEILPHHPTHWMPLPKPPTTNGE